MTLALWTSSAPNTRSVIPSDLFLSCWTVHPEDRAQVLFTALSPVPGILVPSSAQSMLIE